MKSEYSKLLGAALAAAAATALLVLILVARSRGSSPEAALHVALDAVARSRGWAFTEKTSVEWRGVSATVRAEGVVDAANGTLKSTVVVARGKKPPRLYMFYRNRTVAVVVYEGGVLNVSKGEWSVEDTVLYQALVAALEEPEKEIHRREESLVVVASGRPTRSAEALYERLFAMAFPEEEPPMPDTASILVTLAPGGRPKGVLLIYYVNSNKILETIYIVNRFGNPPPVTPPTSG